MTIILNLVLQETPNGWSRKKCQLDNVDLFWDLPKDLFQKLLVNFGMNSMVVLKMSGEDGTILKVKVAPKTL